MTTTHLHCSCGKVEVSVRGRPILSAECLCDSCRAAGSKLEALPGSRSLLEPTGGTRFVLCRKDRVQFVRGRDHLAEMRLSPGAKTRRVVATCCNTPVFLEFKGGHWLSLYSGLWPTGELPPLEMRTMASDLPDGTVLPDDVPNAGKRSGRFFLKLLGAWIAMGFRSPKIDAKRTIRT